mgnify:CR=1 FL=1
MTRRAAFGIQVWSLNQARKKIGGKGTISGKWHPQPALLPTKWVIRANRHEGDIGLGLVYLDYRLALASASEIITVALVLEC